MLLLTATRLDAGQVTLAWDPVADPDVAGYVVVYGTQPGWHPVRLDAGSLTQYTVTGLSDGTYYFAVESYTFGGLTSGPSNEVTATLAASVLVTPPTAASSCATPDPFVALGGGTCYNGNWYPPGMTIPGYTTAPAPAPVPAPTPVSSPSTCASSDPFVALGGGTCYNGNWYPPGMSIPGYTTAPAPAPVPAPTSVPTPVSSPSTCATSDPFVALGGGTCYRGNWYPPGMTIPGYTTAPAPTPAPAPVPAPTSPSAPVSSPSSCATPDPFVALGGGTCYSGNWYPPGMTIPGYTTAPTTTPAPAPTGACPGSDPFIGIPNLIGVCVNGGWVPRPR